MSKIKLSDFYYGAVLSMLLSHGVKPALVENGEDRQVYDISTNKNDFRLFVKYRSKSIETKKTGYSSWVFTIAEDKAELKSFLDSKLNLIVALVCGEQNLCDSQLAVLDADQIKRILDIDKTTINITIKKGERYFRIPIERNREDGIKVKCNRFEELFE